MSKGEVKEFHWKTLKPNLPLTMPKSDWKPVGHGAFNEASCNREPLNLLPGSGIDFWVFKKRLPGQANAATDAIGRSIDLFGMFNPDIPVIAAPELGGWFAPFLGIEGGRKPTDEEIVQGIIDIYCRHGRIFMDAYVSGNFIIHDDVPVPVDVGSVLAGWESIVSCDFLQEVGEEKFADGLDKQIKKGHFISVAMIKCLTVVSDILTGRAISAEDRGKITAGILKEIKDSTDQSLFHNSGGQVVSQQMKKFIDDLITTVRPDILSKESSLALLSTAIAEKCPATAAETLKEWRSEIKRFLVIKNEKNTPLKPAEIQQLLNSILKQGKMEGILQFKDKTKGLESGIINIVIEYLFDSWGKMGELSLREIRREVDQLSSAARRLDDSIKAEHQPKEVHAAMRKFLLQQEEWKKSSERARQEETHQLSLIFRRQINSLPFDICALATEHLLGELMEDKVERSPAQMAYRAEILTYVFSKMVAQEPCIIMSLLELKCTDGASRRSLINKICINPDLLGALSAAHRYLMSNQFSFWKAHGSSGREQTYAFINKLIDRLVATGTVTRDYIREETQNWVKGSKFYDSASGISDTSRASFAYKLLSSTGSTLFKDLNEQQKKAALKRMQTGVYSEESSGSTVGPGDSKALT